MNYYLSVFEQAEVVSIHRYGANEAGAEGTVISYRRKSMISALTSAGQEHDSAQLRQSGYHGLEISEAHSAVAFSTNEEHRLFHSKFTQVRHSRSIFVLTGRRRRE